MILFDGQSQKGSVMMGVTLLGVKTDLLTVSFGSGGSGRSSGPSVCSSRAKGTRSGDPRLPSLKEGLWDGGENEGALTFVGKLSQTH